MTLQTDNVLDVLVYLFDHYSEEQIVAHDTDTTITTELISLGFSREGVGAAFDWYHELLAQLNNFPEKSTVPSSAVRIYAPWEQARFTSEALGCLLYLEQAGIIDADMRELIIERALALNEPVIDLEEVKWVALVIILNMSDFKGPISLLEEMTFNDTETVEH